jgi:putative redox protein
MHLKKISFSNQRGEQLSARLELPANRHPIAFALFAHCFTCNKNLTAVRNISRSLTMSGVAVMRFDFTGLGESEGDFANTNFSSNVEDLVAAARYLQAEYEIPSILIGHSLGGAAVLCAAHELEEVKAVATIGAPYSPVHVRHLLEEKLEDIQADGVATVNIGGRSFQVKKQFLDDIAEQELKEKIKNLGKALLILHSPQDLTVEVENAAKIYHAAHHPKSFISLDGADHLMSNKADSTYAGQMIAAWALRYLEVEQKELLKSDKQVVARLTTEDKFTTDIMVRHHSLTADEPASIGGHDFGPSPYELVSAGLGACTAMTLHMYARRKKWPLEEVRVHIDHFKDHATDCEDMENPESKIDHFDKTIELEGDLNEEQRARLMEIADRCPVHKTLHNKVEINSRLAE